VFNAQPANAGAYTVTISNVAGATTSSPATLTVLTPASITAQPVSRTVVSGSNATFTVSATGSAPLTFQWKFNGTNLGGKTTTSLPISHARPEDAGQYVVAVDNPYGSDHSDPAILTVLSARPIISSFAFVSNHFRVVFQAEPNVTYVVEHKTSFGSTTWSAL